MKIRDRTRIPMSSLSLQNRLVQLIGARVSTLINPFGTITEAKLLKVSKSIIVVQQNSSKLILSPSGLQHLTVHRKAAKATTPKYTITLNSIAREAEKNSPAFLNNRRIVQIGKDFIEVTRDGTLTELIPLSNVTVTFRTATK
ncbi:hypothetical protein [Ammoniphilus sp. YIM 78166]|uniref:hypothetical protein n=1 Tax=Ammoniphilus sp. YIM 78166 TaxID=1644106 RepID=UPI00106F42CB|nr:hypothetical protein [Ammoniphilus sp. YIM 78166]